MQLIELFESTEIKRLNRSWENDSIVVFHHDRIVYHTTAETPAQNISQHGFKTGKELDVAERRSAIFFADKDVNPNLYARNEPGDPYAGQEAAHIAINLKGLRLLNMTYRVDGVFVNHKAFRGASIRGTLEDIPAFKNGEIDGTISFMDDGKISDVCLPKDTANKLRLQESVEPKSIIWKMPRHNGYKRVMIDVAKLDASWSRDKGFYITPGGGGHSIKGRYERFIEWLKQGLPVEMPEVSFNEHYQCISFGNGRHRFSVFRDMGIKYLPVCVPEEQAAFIKKNFG